MMRIASAGPRVRFHRAAFSLIELLVVLGIALIIISLVAAGTFQVIAYQRNSNTETLIRMLMPPLNQQWKTVADMVKNESIPQSVINIAYDPQSPNNDRRARVIWTK